MNWQSLPSLTALRAFAALGETGTVAAAGAALNVSHAAISQQIRALETHLGVALVDRSGHRLELTYEGRQLADVTRNGFGEIAQVVDAMTGADVSRPLHISTTPMFAAFWLMPQIADFHTIFQGHDLILSTTPEVKSLDPGGIDVALRYGDGDWPGLESEPILLSPMVMVAAPSLVGDRAFDDLGELDMFPLLQDTGLSEATKWLRSMGITRAGAATNVQLPGNLVLDAARDGQGIAVAIRAFVENDIASGRLRLLYENDDKKGYHIVTRPGVQRPALKTFIKWLRNCARACKLDG